MKRNLLAIAIPALLVAGAANAAEVYNQAGTELNVTGRVHAFTGYDSAWSDNTSARFGLNGTSQIAKGIKAFGKVEYETKFADANSETAILKNRYAFAGVDFGTLGQISYGKNDGVLTSITDYTDTLPENGGAAGDHSLLSGRTAQVATYANSDFFGAVEGLDFAAQFAAKDAIGDEQTKASGNRAYGLNAQYTIADTGVKVGVGYSQAEKGSNDAAARAIVAAAQYDANDIYVAALYVNSQLSDKTKINGYEAVAKYRIENVRPVVGYFYHKADSGVVYANYADVGVEYALNQNLTAVVDYQIALDKKASGTDYNTSKVNLGVVYNF